LLERAIPFAVPAFVATWLAHVVLTALGDPFGLTVDIVLWVVASVLRLVALLTLFVLLQRVHALIDRSKRRAVRVFALWSCVSVVALGAMALTREQWAPHLSTQVAKYYAVTEPLRIGGPTLAAHRAAWLVAWSKGYVFAAEAALAIALCAVQVLLGLEGKARLRGVPSSVMGGIAVVACLLAYVLWCPWLAIDFDNFHGDLFASALLFDHMSPLANDPYSTISASFYLLAWASCLAALRLFGESRAAA
jgi:hypothetical protein